MHSEIITNSPPRYDNSGSNATSKTVYDNETEKLKSNEIIATVGDEKTITLYDFLDFLNVSCQLDDIIKNSVQQMANTSDSSAKSKKSVQFKQLTTNRVVNILQGQRCDMDNSKDRGDWRHRSPPVAAAAKPIAGTRSRFCDAPAGDLHPQLNKQLDHVIKEGIMDPILPFICPVPLPKSISRQTGTRSKCKQKDDNVQVTVDAKPNHEHNELVAKLRNSAKRGRATRRKSLSSPRKSPRGKAEEKKLETDVVIHVCDEVKNTSRNFYCPQTLLVRKMGYFASIVDKQKLEDMDISVHCDIEIFDWLMRWVKYTSHIEDCGLSLMSPAKPLLDAYNVVPILVSANFLQMEPLLVECLSFCHARLNEVLRTSANLSCINDTIVSRMASMFTNVELELVRDKRERFTACLWTKLIQSLCEAEPEALRGHYFSLAGLYRCSKCGKCLTRSVENYVACVAPNVRLNRWGQLSSNHSRDNTWDMTVFISQLFKELKSWRLVYWRLWGHCHYLYCAACEQHFPVFKMHWCPFHPDAPVFYGPSVDGRNSCPTGRYPCCTKTAFRFETLKTLNGCQFREHLIQSETDRDRAILSIAQLVSDSYAMSLPPKMKSATCHSTKEDDDNWGSILMTSQRPRLGLLPMLNAEEFRGKLGGRQKRTAFVSASSSSENECADIQYLCRTKKGSTNPQEMWIESTSTTSDDECEVKFYGKNYNTNSFCMQMDKSASSSSKQNERFRRVWSRELSARSNQDHQRNFEENMMKKVQAIVMKKAVSDHNLSRQQPAPPGGSYLRLEAEWKENYKRLHHGSESNNTGSNTNIAGHIKPKK